MFDGSIGAGELFIVFLVVLIFLGPDKLPEIGRALGKAVREFRKVTRELELDKPEEPENKKNSDST